MKFLFSPQSPAWGCPSFAGSAALPAHLANGLTGRRAFALASAVRSDSRQTASFVGGVQ